MDDQLMIIDHLRTFFSGDIKRIRGALLIGSFGRGQGTPSSDIDIELLLTNHEENIKQFTNDVVQLFEHSKESILVKHSLWLEDQRKLALYHGPNLRLTELYLYTSLSQIDKYFLGSRITNLDICILLDRDNFIRSHPEQILTMPYDNRPSLVRELLAHIQYLLESTASARTRNDAYKFYFLSNIALHELVRLSYVLSGRMEYNYNPPRSKVDPNLASTMDMNKSSDHLRKLVVFFCSLFDAIDDNEKPLVENARAFCQDLLNRDSLVDTLHKDNK